MRSLRFVCASFLSLVACSAPDPLEESVGEYGQALETPEVLGFEDLASWTASAGTKSASTDRTEGEYSLALASFTYAELQSVPLSTVPGVSDTLAFDIKPPEVPAWGQAALFVSAPSLGIYNASLGQVALAGSPGGAYRTLSFQVPSTIVAALGQSFSDLTFKIALNVPQTAQPYLVDNLRFVGGSTTSTVRVSVSGVDDFVYLSVNGLRRKVVPLGSTISDLDISDWFVAGTNSLRVQAIDTGEPSSYTVQVTVDGVTVVNESCSSGPCQPGMLPGRGIVFDQTYSIVTPNRPPAEMLTVNGTAGGAIYIDDAYTGHVVPHTFALPPGGYIVGVGVGEGFTNQYVGEFYEEQVTLEDTAVSIEPTAGSPLAFPNHTKVALLPIRTTYHGDDAPENTGVLTQSDIDVMHGQTIATRDAYVEPFSYGLTTWDIDLLPVVEDTPLHRAAASNLSPDIGRFLDESGLRSLESEYDIIIYFFSKFTASGAPVANDPCCWWGINQLIAFPNHLTRDPNWPETRPNFYLLHESLHDYESYNQWRLFFYNGADGTHGGGTHGYPGGGNGEEDFLFFYRRFMRNQVAELNTMRGGVDFGSQPATSADLWVGVFDTMRRDVDWGGALLASGVPSVSDRARAARSLAKAPESSMCGLPVPPSP
ncbi:MAG TPA: hypothetical protein VKY73_09415 [Polyangiaceae bacterium]|nr:hypothetical protein [Polyangiaceae bacterium]